MIRKLLLLFLVSIITQLTFAQVPGNDCASATALTLVSGGTISTGLQSMATLGGTYDVGISCTVGSGFYGDATDGVYSINVTSAGAYTFAFDNTGDVWKSLSIHSGCAPTNGNCVGGIITGGLQDGTSGPIILTPSTYYLVVDSWMLLTPSASFTLEITSPLANDECSGAIGLTVNADQNCGSTTAGSTVSATASSQADDVSGTPDNDVWYSFVATNTSHTVSLLNVVLVNGSNDMGIGVYNGSAGCGSLAFEATSDPNSLDLTGLTIGDLYYVRVYGWFIDPTDEANFNVCVGTPPPPPTNDECSGAIGLTVNADQDCGTTTQGSTVSATASPQADDVSGTPDNDIWFSFTATNTTHRVSLLNLFFVSGSTDMGIGVYNGSAGCGSLVFEATSDPNILDLTGLTIGNLYYVRIYGWFADPTDQANFDVCVGTPPPPPSNDECSGAIGLTVNTDRNCGTTTPGTTVSATASPQADDVSGTPDNDVWYSFTATNTSHTVSLLNVVLVNGSTDMGIGVYNGTSGCASLTFEATSDPNILDLTGLTIGDLYYVRVYGWFLDPTDQANFDVCVGSPPPPPANDEPCTAAVLTPGQTCVGTPGYVEQATNTGINPCGGTPNDDVWYSFVATNTTHYIDLTNVIGNRTDMYHAVYGGFTTIPADCSVTVGDNITCSDANSSTTTGLTIGQTYFIQVYSFSALIGATTSFDICVTEPCILPTPITTPSCPFVDVTPDASTIVGSCGSAGAGSETLTADFLDLGDTSDYDVDLINYDATMFANLAAAATSTVALSNDDRWSDLSYPMPIDFCFFGTTITDFVIGANGIISFDTSLANSGSGYTFDENLPSIDESLVDNAIYVASHDIDPGVIGSGSITFGSTSIGGCNVMVVLWDDIPMYLNAQSGDNSKRHTAMAILYEDTNIIEILIEEKVIDDFNFTDFWNDGNAIVGIQNAGATQSATAPCRNSLDENWATTNEAWRFTPSGGASIANLQWLVNGTLNATYNGLTSITVSPAATTTYTAQVTYTLCDNSKLVITDNAVITATGGKVWDGSEATNNWMDPLNWSDNTIPTAADCVIIPVTGNDPVIYDNDNGDGLYLSIETGATLTLTSDTDNDSFASSLTIQDNINIQGTGSLIVQDDASLIQVYDSSTLATLPSGPNTGSIELYRDTDIRQLDYVYWSSPVQNFDVSNVYGGFTPTGRIYEWMPTVATGNFTPGVLPTGGIPICYGNWNPLSSGVMNLGKGYIVRGPTNHTAGISTATSVFTGVPNNGVITQPITSGGNSFGNSNYTYNPYGVDNILVTPFDDNWNLLGNPYPSALDAQSFLTHSNNSIIEGAVHIWTHGIAIGNNGDSFYDDFVYTYSVNDYITYNFSGTNTYTDESFGGKIGSGQSFFVLALADDENGSNSVTFNNSMRSSAHSNTAFYRTENTNENVSNSNTIERNRIWLNLVDQNGSISSMLVGYIEGATQEKDRLFDAFTREVNEINLYSKIGDQRMIIQGRALPFDENDQVPLGTVIPRPGEYTIAISNVDGLFLDENQAIYLEDKYTGIIHNLRATPYSFTETETIDYEDRFILRYTDESLSINELELDSGLTILAPKGDYIKVNSESSLIDSVIVYDLLGRVLFDKNSINETEFVLKNHNLSSGAYIVKVSLSNGLSKTQKVVLKH
ncbi:T9SS sorting signal type C domain-containing protein [Psychroserpens sp.]